MRKNVKYLCLFTACVALSLSLSGCEPAPAPLVETEVRSYSDPAVENILQAMNDADYARFSAGFSELMKKTITPDAFNELENKVINTVGKYQYKQLAQMQRSNQYVVTVYQANFTGEPAGVTVTVSFENTGGKNYVAGLYFTSPKLRAAK
jgi:hypothetical protein